MESELLNRLYRQYYHELYLYLYSLCRNQSQTEDLVQETFLKAMLSLSENHTNIRAWLYMVGRNLFYNEWNKQKKSVSLNECQDTPDDSRSITDRLIADENRRLLYQALGQLDLKKREVLQMQYFDGFSQKEIAAILRITPENVRVLAFRGKKELKAYMEGTGYEIS